MEQKGALLAVGCGFIGGFAGAAIFRYFQQTLRSAIHFEDASLGLPENCHLNQGDLIDYCRQFLWYEVDNGVEMYAAFVNIGERTIATFAHNPHSQVNPRWQIGSIHLLRNAKNPGMEIKVSLVARDDHKDVAILWTDGSSKLPIPRKRIGFHAGMKYIQLGFSQLDMPPPHLSCVEGLLSYDVECLNARSHARGDGGANPGDSGGPCFTRYGQLFGMNVSNDHWNTYVQPGLPLSTPGVITGRAHIVPYFEIANVAESYAKTAFPEAFVWKEGDKLSEPKMKY